MNDPVRSLPEASVLNPYRFGARLIVNRLLWDIRPLSWRSRAKLRTLKGSKIGKRAVIMCNGPSLLKVDLGRLDNVFTFGLNKINLLFEKSMFRPSCIVAVNPHVIEQNAEFYNTTSIPLFLDSGAARKVKPAENRIFLHSTAEPRVVDDVSMSLNQGFTVTCVALQLALHMGFEEVAVVGCDHTFAVKGPPNKEVRAEGNDASHFDPRYFSGGQLWNLPDLAASEFFYSQLYNLYTKLNRRLWNCSDGGKLELFPRRDLVSFLEGKP